MLERDPASRSLDQVARSIAIRLGGQWTTRKWLEVCAAAYLRAPSGQLVSRLKGVTELLPPQALNTLTVSNLQLPVFERPPPWDEMRLSALKDLRKASMPRFDDKTMLEIWPVRAKIDLSIRRTRFRDIFTCWRMGHRTSEFWDKCEKLPNMDLIAVVNIMLTDWLVSDDEFDWFNFWYSKTAFDGTADEFSKRAASVSNQLKTNPKTNLPFFTLLENQVLSGYRNPPYPGFDVTEEAEALSRGGAEHGLGKGLDIDSFDKIARDMLKVYPGHVSWLDLRSFVESGNWETSGASSVGKVEWEFDGKTGHFKARKNMVPDVVDLVKLATMVEEATKQTNIALIKSELGKIRIAVASDMETYLIMSWMSRMLNGCYKQWPGNTLEEDLSAQTLRLFKMSQKIKKGWNLPFDYSSFDHQISTDEILSIVRVLIEMARDNVPSGQETYFDAIAERLVESFSHSTIVARDGDKTSTFPVTGGLMSGLRWTSVIGNAWNTVMTEWVMRTLAQFGVPTHTVERWIRGDDSQLSFDDFYTALATREGYEAMGAESSAGKFGIHYGQSEFLRTWFKDGVARGYPIRAIPGLTQRKPWSSSPWEEESTMSHIYSVIQTLRRRGINEDKLMAWWSAVKLVWSQRRHVSQTWLQIPKHMGGLGVEPWDGRSFVKDRWPRVNTATLKVTNATDFRANQITEQFKEITVLTSGEASQLAQNMMSQKIVSDDIPSINTLFKQKLKLPNTTSYRKPAPRWSTYTLALIEQTGQSLLTLKGSDADLFKRDRWQVGTFGRWHHLVKEFARWSELATVRDVKPVVVMRRRHPGFSLSLVRAESRGMSRSEAVDWLLGKTPINIPTTIHPALSSILASATMQVCSTAIQHTKYKNREFTQLVMTTSMALEKYLLNSTLSRSLYMW
jgi:hypothetical protein